jgi:hypothetical protein
MAAPIPTLIAYLTQNPGRSIAEMAATLPWTREQIANFLRNNPDKFRRKGDGTRRDPYRWFVKEDNNAQATS